MPSQHFIDRLQAGLRLALAALTAALLLSSAGLAAAGPSAPAGGFSVYLPVVLNKPCTPRGQVIFGCVEQNGARLSGFLLTLYRQRNDPPSPTTIAGTAVSDAGGYFQFSNIPPTTGSDYYYLSYVNLTDPTRLRDRDQPLIYLGGQYDLGVVDVTNIPLFAPADGLHVTFPYTFTWGLRPTSPKGHYADYYVVVWVGTNGSFAYSQQGVGYVGSHRQDYLPDTLQYGTEYDWFVRNQPEFPYEPIIEDSYQMFRVTFDSTNGPLQGPSAMQTLLDPLHPPGTNTR
jgi:hypothetical protein